MTRLLLVVLAVCLLAGPAAGQPGKDDVARTLAAWKARQGKMKTARYVLAGTVEHLAPVQSGDAMPPPDQRVRPLRATVLLDLERGRVRMESAEEQLGVDGKYYPAEGTYTYDGREVRHFQPRHLVREHGGYDLIIGKRSPTDRGGTYAPNYCRPVLFAHGIAPTVHTPAYLDKLPLNQDPEDWATFGRQPLGGGMYDVFRTEPAASSAGTTDEYWVDPARDGAVRRYVYRVGNRPWFRHDVDWRRTPAGWWPERWTYTFTNDGVTPNHIYTVRVEAYEYDPPVADGDFTVPAEPGMERVRVVEPVPAGGGMNPDLPPYREYRISPSGEWVETKAKGLTTLDGVELPPERWWHRWPWAAGVVVLAAAAVGVRAWRRRRAPA
ncbi:MAG: hypothetical protein K2X82_06055 [Gemmataceae bacterium]|nr:hypothetical protein [Gemmataceae bacterium]